MPPVQKTGFRLDLLKKRFEEAVNAAITRREENVKEYNEKQVESEETWRTTQLTHAEQLQKALEDKNSTVRIINAHIQNFKTRELSPYRYQHQDEQMIPRLKEYKAHMLAVITALQETCGEDHFIPLLEVKALGLETLVLPAPLR